MEERYESQLALSARVLDDVDCALERLSAGTYHSCESCGAPLLEADFAEDPTRRACAVHGAPSSDLDFGDLDSPGLGSF